MGDESASHWAARKPLCQVQDERERWSFERPSSLAQIVRFDLVEIVRSDGDNALTLSAWTWAGVFVEQGAHLEDLVRSLQRCHPCARHDARARPPQVFFLLGQADATLVDEVPEHTDDLLGHRVIHMQRGLVDAHHLGVGDQRPRDDEHVLFGAAEGFAPDHCGRRLLLANGVEHRCRQSQATADVPHALDATVRVALRHAQCQVLVQAPLDEHIFRWHVQNPQVRRNEEDAAGGATLPLRPRQRRTSEDPKQRALPHAALADEAHELALVYRHALVEHPRLADLLPHVGITGAQGAQVDADVADLDGDAILDRLPGWVVQILAPLNILERRAGDLVLVPAPLHPAPDVGVLIDDVDDSLQGRSVVEGLQELAVDVAPQLPDLHVDPKARQEDARGQGAVDDLGAANDHVRGHGEQGQPLHQVDVVARHFGNRLVRGAEVLHVLLVLIHAPLPASEVGDQAEVLHDLMHGRHQGALPLQAGVQSNPCLADARCDQHDHEHREQQHGHHRHAQSLGVVRARHNGGHQLEGDAHENAAQELEDDKEVHVPGIDQLLGVVRHRIDEGARIDLRPGRIVEVEERVHETRRQPQPGAPNHLPRERHVVQRVHHCLRDEAQACQDKQPRRLRLNVPLLFGWKQHLVHHVDICDELQDAEDIVELPHTE
mmetsp:Transcript_111031/g.310234  ORF Transcript_111031/g.310234 Transcript_111031/m.310234 type:complete len:662 (-) Transcript_111031:940-2925(-)